MPLVKVADFGLARLVEAAEDARLTTTGATVGTLNYMSPEQLRGEAVDARSDIFSLGATAFHLLSGKPPLAGRTTAQIIAQRLAGGDESLTVARPGISPASAELVAAMMAPDPERRIADYAALLKRIDGLNTARNPADAGPATIDYLPAAASAPTATIRTDSPPQRPSWLRGRTNQFCLALIGLALVLALIGGLVRRDDPGRRDLVESGRTEPLFNGRNLDGWTVLSGGWNPAQNKEGAIVLQGRGAVRHPLALGQDAEVPQPVEHYRLTFFVDIHSAAAVELQFGAGQPGQDAEHVVRIDSQRSTLGSRAGEGAEPARDRGARAFGRRRPAARGAAGETKPGLVRAGRRAAGRGGAVGRRWQERNCAGRSRSVRADGRRGAGVVFGFHAGGVGAARRRAWGSLSPG